jgi:hypothetical protein
VTRRSTIRRERLAREHLHERLYFPNPKPGPSIEQLFPMAVKNRREKPFAEWTDAEIDEVLADAG